MRDFDIRTDEPPSAGGTDEGPTPTELFLASLATCFTLAVAHVARKRDVALDELSVRVEADYEGLRFARLRLEITTDLPLPDTGDLVEQAKRYCFVSRTLLEPPQIEYVVADSAP